MSLACWLSPCPAPGPGWRRHAVTELLPVAEREARALGAARPSDLSGLDETGMPCWQVVRPEALDLPGNITVLNGKGWTGEESRLGAWMEFLERHWGENPAVECRIARPSELERRGHPYLPPSAVPLPHGMADPGDVPLAWVAGTDLRGEEVLVPAHDVICPFVPPPGAANPPIWRSAGLAAGGHPTEAVFHGLLELVERDAVAVGELAQVGTSVDLATSGSPWMRELLPRLAAVDVFLEVKELPTAGGATTYLASLDDRRSGNPMRLVSGHAAHLDPYLALERAVLEALQARTVIIAGSREDLDSYAELAAMDFDAARRELSWWLDPTPDRVAAPAAPLDPPADLADALIALEATLREHGFAPLVAVKLTPPGSPVSVMRAVLPGGSEVSHGTLRLGRRLRVVEEEPAR